MVVRFLEVAAATAPVQINNTNSRDTHTHTHNAIFEVHIAPEVDLTRSSVNREHQCTIILYRMLPMLQQAAMTNAENTRIASQ